MFRRLGLLLVISLPLFGQHGDTIYAQVVSSGNQSSAKVMIAPPYTIGQSGHEIYLELDNSAGHTCNASTATLSAQLFGSFSSSNASTGNWVSITNLVSTSNVSSSINYGNATTYGQGLFPYLSVRYTLSDTTNCVANIWYGGAITSNVPANTTGFAQIVTNGSNATASTVIPNSFVSGHVGHEIYFELDNAAGHTCNFASATLSAQLFGSFNSSNPAAGNWIPITNLSLTSQVSTSANYGTATSYGQGMYPYLMTTYTLSDTTNCVANVWYGGTIGSIGSSIQTNPPNVTSGQIVTGGNTSPSTVILPTQLTAGNTVHQILFQLANAPGHTCPIGTASASGSVLAGFSATGGTLAPTPPLYISPTVTTLTQLFAPEGLTIGQGGYPYIAFYYTNSDTTNCVINAWYSGSVTNVTTNPAYASQNYFKPSTIAYAASGNGAAQITENTSRQSAFSSLTPTTGAAASVASVGAINANVVTVDCVTITAIPTVTTTAANQDVLIISNAGSSNYAIPISVPSGAAVGQMYQTNVCGLKINVNATFGSPFTLAMSTGIPNVKEYLSISYFVSL